MSYLVLARKYRPRDFEALVGQEPVVQALSNALAGQRLHHAYLFTGTRGVGKTTVSRILAKALNCTGPEGRGGITASPCGQCAACHDIDEGRFVDYVELDAASNRGVEEIAQLLDQAVYKPVVGRFKVYMIDEVHMLTTHAFNAMLKTLEEPPEYLKFVLATTDPQKIPPTVLSRCLQFNLRPMAPPTVQAHLERVLAAEGVAADGAALRLIARAARGSMRDALSLADQAIAHGAGRLEADSVRHMLGAVDRGHALRLADALVRRDGAAIVAGVDELRGLGLSAAAALEELATLLQQVALAQVVPEALDEQDDATAELRRLAPLLAPDETQLAYGIVLHGRNEIGLAPDEYGGLLMVLLRWLAFPPAGGDPTSAPAPHRAQAAAPVASAAPVSGAPAQLTPAPVAANTEPPDWVTQGPPVAEPSAQIRVAPEPATVPASPLVTTTLGDRWEAHVRALIEKGAVSALARELALQSECVAIAGDDWRLRVERDALRAPAQRERLQAALRQLLDAPLTLTVELGATQDTPARREVAARALRLQQAEQAIREDPLVQTLLRQYSTARIVPGSVKPH